MRGMPLHMFQTIFHELEHPERNCVMTQQQFVMSSSILKLTELMTHQAWSRATSKASHIYRRLN